MAGQRPYRYAQGDGRVGAPDPGRAGAGPVCRGRIRVSRPQRLADQGALARWCGSVALCQAPCAGSLHLAFHRLVRGSSEWRADGLFARRHRLAQPAAELAPDAGRIGYIFFGNGSIFGFTPGDSYDSIMVMQARVSPMPDDVEALKAALAASRIEVAEAKAEAATVRAERSDDQALIAHLKLQIEKLKHQLFGSKSERSRRLLDQLELQLEELEATASQDEAVAQIAARKVADAPGFERRRPSRQPFPEHLPRERRVIAAPCACPACGGTRLSRIGEDVTETLEVIPRQWKVIQTVREKVACR